LKSNAAAILIAWAVLWLPGLSLAASDSAAQPVLFTSSEVRADLEDLYQRMQVSHIDLYARRARPAYQSRYEHVRKSIKQPMSLPEVQRLFQKFLAYGRIAHSRIEFNAAEFERFRQANGRVFPLNLRPTSSAVVVARNLSGNLNLAPGTEVLSVDGVPVARWMERLGEHISADSDYLLHVLLERQMPAYVWLEHAEQARFKLQIRTGKGKLRQVTVKARTRAQMQRADQEQPSGPALDWTDRKARMLEGGLAYLRIGAFFDVKGEGDNIWNTADFAEFINQSFAQFRQQGARALLIDLRDNPGGDNSFSDLLVQHFADKPFRFAARFRVKVSQAAIDTNAARLKSTGDDGDSTSAQLARHYQRKTLGEIFDFSIEQTQPLPVNERFSGKVFLLINRQSFSNAVIVAAMCQDARFATILGEETADLASTYGAMEQFKLSRTGIQVGFPKAQIIRPSGDTSARGVIPDIAIATPLVEGRDDPVLREALRLVEAEGNR